MSPVVRQLLPTLSAHKAGSSTPLQNQKYSRKISVKLMVLVTSLDNKKPNMTY